MSALTWSEALALQQPQMDETHREFVDLLADLESALGAEPADLGARFDRFLAHTEAHFGEEDRWMAILGLDPGNCHATQHAQVLQLMHAVRSKLHDEGNTAIVAQLVPALAEWFPTHAQNMDGGLAQVMLLTGLDPVTGVMRNPPQAAAAATTAAPVASGGCASCG